MPAHFTVDVIDTATDQSLPTISHNGAVWVVSDPGLEFRVRVRLFNAVQSDHKVFLTIDGMEVGYSKVMYRQQQLGISAEATFDGFIVGAVGERSTYRAFKFAACKPSEGAALVQHPDEIKAGRIDVQVAAVRAVGTRDYESVGPARVTDEASKQRLPEGKKWFLAPGLKAEAGTTVTKQQNWIRTDYQTISYLPGMQLRYDTHEALVLRKVLNPNLPGHRAILRTSKIPRIARMGSSDAEDASSKQQRQPSGRAGSSSGRPAGVKREDVAGVKRELGEQSAVPGSATAETVDLTGERRAGGPLLINGQAVGTDETAVCDLCDSDEEGPTWQVKKKQATSLE